MILSMMSCNHKQKNPSKYEINGYVFKDSIKYASVWYVDTFEVHGTDISYKNSDGNRIVIQPPYRIKKNYCGEIQ